MAKMILKDAKVIINGVDLSDHVASVAVNLSQEDVDVTAMGAAGKQRLPGLKDESFEITWLADWAAAKTDATLQGLYNNGTSHTVEVRPTSGARSATNPAYLGSECYCTEYTPLSGDVGSRGEAKSTHVVSGAITFPTS